MLRRYLGASILTAIGDPDVAEVYINPQDCAIRLDTCSRGKVDSGAFIAGHRVEMFLNAVASRLGGHAHQRNPPLEAELPVRVFAGARLEAFVPPATSGQRSTAGNQRHRFTRSNYVAAGVLSEDHAIRADRTILEDTIELQCSARDELALRTTTATTRADLLRSALRTSRNRIIVTK
jgi:type IV secretion system protein VirB11